MDLTDIVKFNLNGVQMLGYLCPDYHERSKKNSYYFYSAFSVGLIYVTSIIVQLGDVIAVFGDIEKMTNACFLTLSNVIQAFKLYPFIVHGSKVWKLINGINRKEFQPNNLEQQKILADNIKMSKLITTTWLCICSFICSLLAVVPFLDKGPDEPVRLPLSGWFPFETDKSPVFELVYIYQIGTTVLNGWGVILMDTFIMGIIMVISGQLDVLNNAFDNIQQCEESYEVREKLIRDVIHYRIVLEFADEMTALFTTCILSQFVVTVIISCITLFELTLVSLISFQFLSMFLYEGCILLEIFLWCYYGNEVIVKSDQLTSSAYLCDWTDCSKEFKSDLLFFMTRSQIPLKLYAGGYFTLSLQTFMTIVKSSWSYFAVLNRVHAD